MSRAIVLTCLILFGLSSVRGEEKKQLPKADDKGFIPLFDGKTLTNWKATNFGGEGEVLTEEGCLIMKAGEPLTGVTWDGAELPKSNYEISLEAKRVQGDDFFCALTAPVGDSACSLVLGGWGGTVIGISNINGFDASENETTDYFSFDKDHWYKIRLRVTDTHIQAWIDKDQIANVDYSDKQISVRIEVEVSRPLGLATFQTEGHVRNFKLQKLKTEAK
ncbi:MAG: DUF1080 domain-containing protein [Planctomycetaceae bacterium]|nr:DUF1080 domain-containing protein [Planctomycetaceae bacterium]MCA9029188.1 DUF1080 domain-containing protein [Planctomycetaceae bacterium]MCA9044095.1 DUF1080 domain-containing protein [Planctomycetaceae bacterium]